jgi:hypothetical protein
MAKREMPTCDVADQAAPGSPYKTVDLPGNPKTKSSLDPQHQNEKKTVKPVAKAKRQKKSLGKKFTETFLGEDIENVKDYLIFDVLIPKAKETISDFVSQGIDILLFGEKTSKSDRVKRSGGKSYVSYSSYYEKPENNSRYSRPTSRSRHSFDDILLETRGEADEVLSCLVELVDRYGCATVADLYDLVGVTSEYTDNKWGWEMLGDASIRRTRDGYLLELPRPIVLEN